MVITTFGGCFFVHVQLYVYHENREVYVVLLWSNTASLKELMLEFFPTQILRIVKRIVKWPLVYSVGVPKIRNKFHFKNYIRISWFPALCTLLIVYRDFSLISSAWKNKLRVESFFRIFNVLYKCSSFLKNYLELICLPQRRRMLNCPSNRYDYRVAWK